RRVTRPANKFVWLCAKSPASAGFFVGGWLAVGWRRTAEPLVVGSWGAWGGRGRRACGGRQEPHPCGPCFAPSMALNTPARPSPPTSDSQRVAHHGMKEKKEQKQ